jgi:dihydrolipoamide dehydrogenase
MKRYDLIVVGSGSAGYVAALEAAAHGKNAAVVERKQLGGTCLNRGCIPTKALLHGADALRNARAAGEFGLSFEGATLDYEKLWGYKDRVVGQLRDGIAFLFKRAGVEFIEGEAEIAAPGRVLVNAPDGNFEILADNILVATGSRPHLPPIPGIKLPGVLTSDHLLEQNNGEIKRLVIIGGGVIGMEFASIYSGFGAEVTVVEAAERILLNFDREIAQNLRLIMKRRGVEIFDAAAVGSIEQAAGGLECRFEHKGSQKTVAADAVLAATGRAPCIDGLFAPELNPALERGFLAVDAEGRTNIEGIWAAGDVTGGIQLAHAASAMAKRCVRAMFGGDVSGVGSLVPSCVYTDPEIACAGLSADEAKQRGLDVRVRKAIMSANARTLIARGDRGFIKLVEDAGSKRLLGAQMMCQNATDMIGELALAIENNMTYEQISAVIRPHPSFNEAVGEMA